MSIFLTGASGLLGSAIIREAHHQGLKVIPHYSSNLSSNIKTEAKVFNFQNIDDVSVPRPVDCVIHTATLNESRIQNYSKALAVTLVGTQALVEKSIQSDVRRFIYISTTQVYPHEGKIDETSTPSIQTKYSLQHRLTEQLLEYYSIFFEDGVTVLRVSNVFSDSEIALRNRNKLVPTCFVHEAYSSGVISLRTSGSQTRSFIHDESVAQICIEEVHSKVNGFQIRNVASDFTPTIIDVANYIVEEFHIRGKKVDINRGNSDETNHNRVSIVSLFRNLPGYTEQETKFKSVIRNLVSMMEGRIR